MTTEEDHRFHRGAIVDSIQRVAIELFGATIVERRPFPEASFAIQVVDDPLAGVRAAALALSVGRARLYDFACQARSVGRTWQDIADALGISDNHGIPAELAFELVVEGSTAHARAAWRPTAGWTCGDCGWTVADGGPYDAIVANNETGHDESCPRLRRAR
ncbi:hypothetical protein BG618_02848 [Pseudonocardia autotrophica]|nr:hypothetical protein BG618_02848 [Pseudonocardia autotrophica]